MLQFFIHLILTTTVSCEMESFIVGGEYSDIHRWPFIALLYVEGISENNQEQGSTCGGSLISSQTVLTAAHCTDDLTQKHKNFGRYIFSIYMGNSLYTEATMIRKVKDYIAHSNYDPHSSDVHCDISLMFLESPVRFSHTVKKVILVPPGSEVTRGMRVEVAGWGMTSLKTIHGSTKLKAAVQKMLTTHDCRRSLEAPVPGVVCAASSQEFAYRGDSGGPLVRKSDHFQVGIVSYRMMHVGVTVYTSVAYYHSWIKRTQKTLFTKYCHRHPHAYWEY